MSSHASIKTPRNTAFSKFLEILKTAAASIIVAGSLVTGSVTQGVALDQTASTGQQFNDLPGLDCDSSFGDFLLRFDSSGGFIFGSDNSGFQFALAYPLMSSGTFFNDASLTGVPVLTASALEVYCSGPDGLSNVTNLVNDGLAAASGAAFDNDTFYGVTFTATDNSEMVDYNYTIGYSDPNGTSGTTSLVASRVAVAVPEPEIGLSSSVGGAVADDGNDLQGNVTGNVSNTITYTVSNTGPATLTLSGTPSFSNLVNMAALPTVNGYTSGTTVLSGQQTTFTVTYTPPAIGAYSFDVSFANDDADENPYNWKVSGTAVARPEISVSSDQSMGEIASGTSFTRVSAVAGVSQTDTYTILNQGSGTLTLFGSPNVTGSSNVQATPTASAFSSTTVAPGGTATFTVDYTPTTSGVYGYSVAFSNNDLDEGTYQVAANGTAVAPPEIDLSSSSALGSIASGGSETLATTAAQSALTTTYTITNSGASPLTLSGAPSVTSLVNLSAPPAVSAFSTSTVAANGGTATFTVGVTPVSAGTFSYNLSITSDDADENPYTIAASGTATGTPEIQLSRLTVGPINDGGSVAAGSVAAGVEQTISMQISNQGTDTLTLTPVSPFEGATLANRVNIDSSSASTAYGTISVGAFGQTTFDIKYTPSVAGLFSFNVSVVSDDADESPYVISVSGTATGAPEISMSSTISGGSEIADGGSQVVASTIVAQSFLTTTYTITNTGRAPLTLTGSPTVSNLTNIKGSATTTPFSATTVAPLGGTATFIVTVVPNIGGAYSYDLAVTSDDADEGTYNISTSGTALGRPEISISSSATGGAEIADEGSQTLPGLFAAQSNFVTTYTVTNSGTAPLTLTGTAAVSNLTNLSGTPVVSAFGETTLAPLGGSTTFNVQATPTIAGAFSYDLAVTSNDSNEGTYNFSTSGTANGTPEINVSRSGVGQLVTGTGTQNFGTLSASFNATQNLQISNSGTGPLLISGITFSNEVNVAASVTSAIPSSIAPGGTATITVTLNAPLAGAYSFDMNIANNDSDESPFEIAVAGSAIGFPDIDIVSSTTNTSVNDGASTSVSPAEAGVQETVTFTVKNVGTDTLNLSGRPTAANLTNVTSPVTLGDYGQTVIAPGGSTTFTAMFSPSLAGNFRFDIDVISDDPNEGTYDIGVAGSATGRPEIGLSSSRGGAFANGTDEVLGNVQLGETVELTYTITNTGLNTLTLPLQPTLTMNTNVGTPVITAAGLTSLAPVSGTTTFTVRVTPAALGAFSTQVRVLSNDNDESSYIWNITGTAIGAPEIAITASESGPLASGGTDTLPAIEAGNGKQALYTITNTGTVPLTLTGTKPALSNVTNLIRTPTVSNYSTTTVAPGGGTATFTVLYFPLAAGAFGYDLSVTSDDADESPYVISATGTATGAPEISVSSVVSGTLVSGGSDALNTVAARTSQTVTYTITNSGTDVLTLSGAPVVSSTVNTLSPPTVSDYSTTSVAPNGGTATFTVDVAANVAGLFRYTVTINSNDSDEAAFAIVASGTATGAPSVEFATSTGSAILNGGSTDLGTVPGLEETTVTYTITNNGLAEFELTSSLPRISSPTNTLRAPRASAYSTRTIPPLGGTATFTVTYIPELVGPFGFDVTVFGTDLGTGFTFSASGTATGEPEISVSSFQSGLLIDGGAPETLSASQAGTARVAFYTIRNSGADVLNISGINVVSASNVTSLPVASDPSTTAIAPNGGEAVFNVTFTPQFAGDFGYDLQIISDDTDEGVFDIQARGVGLGDAEIRVVSDISGVIGNTGSNQLGNVTAGEAFTTGYTISNRGLAPLVLTGEPTFSNLVNIEGNPTITIDFRSLSQPSASAIPILDVIGGVQPAIPPVGDRSAAACPS